MNPRAFVGLISLLLFTQGCHHEAKPTAVPPTAKAEGDKVILPQDSPQANAVAVAPVEVCNSAITHLNGRLLWDDDVTVRVYSAFAGRVIELTGEVGRTVAKGDCLARIVSTDYGQAQADARRSVSDFALAERNLSRLHELYDHGAAALKDLQAAEADYERAQAEKVRSTTRLALYGGSTNTIDQVYQLKSPLAGMVVERSINPGQEVRPDQILANAPQFFSPLFVITDPTHLWIQVDATEQDLPRLKQGQELIIRSRAYPERVFKGRVDLVSDFFDPATRTIKVRGSLENPGRLLKAEMFVEVDLSSTGPLTAGLDVPAKAVLFKNDKHYVFVEEAPGKYQKREVKVGPEHDGKILVLEGLHPGQRVVTEGSLLLDQLLVSSNS
jgi:cobalt-zinc-cadmium efflux system membrane fusion protein